MEEFLKKTGWTSIVASAITAIIGIAISISIHTIFINIA